MDIKKQNTVKTMVIIGLVAYFLFLTYRAVVYNYQTNKKITSLEQEITLLELEEEYIRDLNVYYGTNTYKELEGRRKLGLKKADEEAVKIPIDPNKLAQYERREIISKTPESPEQEQQKSMANPRKWIKFVLRI